MAELTVLYDGACNLCRASVARVRGMDTRGLIELLDLHDASVSTRFPQVNLEEAMRLESGPKGVPAVGGAMDLVHGAKRVAVITDHVTKEGEPKLLDRCTMPLTGVACVTRVYTSLAVVDVEDGRFVLREKLPGISLEKLQSVTGARLHLDGGVANLIVPEL